MGPHNPTMRRAGIPPVTLARPLVQTRAWHPPIRLLPPDPFPSHSSGELVELQAPVPRAPADSASSSRSLLPSAGGYCGDINEEFPSTGLCGRHSCNSSQSAEACSGELVELRDMIASVFTCQQAKRTAPERAPCVILLSTTTPFRHVRRFLTLVYHGTEGVHLNNQTVPFWVHHYSDSINAIHFCLSCDRVESSLAML